MTRLSMAKSRSFWWTALPFVAALTPVLVLAYISWEIASDAVRDSIETGNRTAASIAAGFIEEEFETAENLATTVARLPSLVEAVSERRIGAAQDRLRLLVEENPRIERALVTDLDARLIADWPPAPESPNIEFKDRDWYRRVTEERQPIVSEVYRRDVRPSVHVVSIATPIHAPTGETIGLLVYQLSLEDLSARLEQVSRIAEDLFVLDHTGTLLAHPQLLLEEANGRDAYASVPAVKQALAGKATAFENDDPLSGTRMTGAAVPIQVGSRRWVVVAQQPAAAVTAPLDLVTTRLLVAGGLLALLSLGAAAGLAWLDARSRRLTRELETAGAIVLEHERTLSVASHEIRNPLGPLSLQVQILRKRLELESPSLLEKFEPSLSLLDRQVKRISRLVDELLDVRRNRGSAKVERVNLSALVRDVVQQGTAEAQAAGVTLEVDAPSTVNGYWQRTRLEQVVANLVSNAIKYAPGRPVRVSVRLDGSLARLEVRDHGPGIRREDRDRVFRQFERAVTDEDGTTGVGLGLWVVREIVTGYGGSVWIEDAVGGGATFVVTLPVEHDLRAQNGEDRGARAEPE